MPEFNQHAYGFDPAFRHGALVYTRFDKGSDQIPNRLAELKVVYAWDKKNGVGTDAEPIEFFKLAQRIVEPMAHLPILPVAIDWNPKSVYWRAAKLQMVQLGLFIGYFTRALHGLGFPVVFINPEQVRRALGSNNPRAKKEEVHGWFSSVCDYSEYASFLNRRNTDFIDATILAYLLAQSMPSEGQYTWQFLTSPD